MPKTIYELREYADRAGNAYSELKARQKNGFFTKDQKKRSRYTFIDNHVSIFDDYFEELEKIRAEGRTLDPAGLISGNAKILARDIAKLHPNSRAAASFRASEPQFRPLAQRPVLNTGGGLQGAVKEIYAAHSESKLSKPELDAMHAREKAFRDRERRRPLIRAERELRKAQEDLERLEERMRDDRSDMAERGSDLGDVDRPALGEKLQTEDDPEVLEETLRRAQERVRNARHQLETEQEKFRAGEKDQKKDSDEGSGIEDLILIKEKEEEGEEVIGGSPKIKLSAGTTSTMSRGREDEEEEEGKEEEDEERGLNAGLSKDQERGLMEIGAWMYRNARHGIRGGKNDHTPFVEGILNRSAREKLLMYYMIEFDKIHNLSTPVILVSQDYIPNLDRFKKKMRGHFWRYFSSNYFQWDKLSDAAMAAAGAKPFLSGFGNLKAFTADKSGPAEEERSEEEESLLIEERSEREGSLSEEERIQEEEEILERPRLKQDLEQHLREVITAAQACLADNPALGAVETLSEKLDDLRALLEDEEEGVEGAEGITEEALRDAEKPVGPGGSSKVSKTKKRTGKLKKLMGYIKTPAAQTGKMLKQGLKSAAEGSQEAKDLSKSAAAFNWTAMPFTVLSAIVSLVDVFITCYECAHAGKDIRAAEKAFKVFMSGKSIIDFGSGTYSSVTSIAGLANAGWVKTGGATATAWVGIGTGALTMGAGLYKLSEGGDLEEKSKEAGEALERYDPALELLKKAPKDMSPEEQRRLEEQKEALEGRRQMLLHITKAGEKSGQRQEITAGLQIAQGGLQVISGMLALGGVTAFATAALSLLSFTLGIISTGVDKKMKKGEWRSAIDDFLNMDFLYNKFRSEQTAAIGPRQFRERYGNAENTKAMLRREAEGLLGFPSDEKFYSHIMWLYARGLYQGCFLKDDGTVISRQDRDAEQGTRKKDRNLCMKTLKAYGLKIRIPEDEDETPVPSINSIYKKMMA